MGCKKCGGTGHNSLTCKASRPAPALAKDRRQASTLEQGSVAEQLRARKARLEQEIATIDRLLPDLDALEAMNRS